MKKIVSTLIFEGRRIEDVLSSLKDLSLELRYTEGHFYPYVHEDIKNLKRMFEEKNIQIAGIHAPDRNVDIGSDDEWERNRSLREVEKSIVTCHYLGGKYIVLHPGTDTNFEITENSIKALKEFADEWNIEIYLENMPPYKNGFWSDRFLEIVENTGIYICIDSGHLLLQGVKIEDIEDKIDGLVKHIHLHNNDGESDKHWGVKKGKYDLSEFLNIGAETVTLELEEGVFDEEVKIFFDFIDSN